MTDVEMQKTLPLGKMSEHRKHHGASFVKKREPSVLASRFGSWSTHTSAAEFRDLGANVMAVDYLGERAVLAGRRYLAMVNLVDPIQESEVIKVPRQSKWEVSAIQFNPHKVNGELFAAASNQRADVYTWGGKDAMTPVQSFKGHTRVISDLDWSQADPNLLATCSVDMYLYVWDLRESRRPACALSAVAGASQVRWNPYSDLIATSHDGDVRIWDYRKSNAPVQYIAAHLSKIHGLDWDPDNENKLATSSQDSTVKFWNITNPRKPENMLCTGLPVWRARFAPFREGLVTVVVPQLRRGDNSLWLWNCNQLHRPVHAFVGSTDVILEFHWKYKDPESKNFFLYTWSKDQTLRSWKCEPFVQRLCGCTVDEDYSDDSDSDWPAVYSTVDTETDDDADSRLSGKLSIKVAQEAKEVNDSPPPATSATSPPPLSPAKKKSIMFNFSPPQPKTLQQEFALLNLHIDSVTITDMNVTNRMCSFTAGRGKQIVKLLVRFPALYPNHASPPAYQFVKGTTVDDSMKERLLKVLVDTSQQHVRRNQFCLEPCLRQLVSTMNKYITHDYISTSISDTVYSLSSASNFLSTNVYGGFQDATVPFPRTTGARFCSVGKLVCFTHSPALRNNMLGSNEVTPRSLSALSAFSSLLPPDSQWGFHHADHSENVRVSSFYYKDKGLFSRSKGRSRQRRLPDITERQMSDESTSSNTDNKAGAVVIHDISALLPVHKDLANMYTLTGPSLASICASNSNAAGSIGRKDLKAMWKMAALSSSHTLKPIMQDPDAEMPWAQHLFGRKFFHTLLDHYSRMRDVQTVAMLLSMFGTCTEQSTRPRKSTSTSSPTSSGNSPYHTIQSSDGDVAHYRLRRSNSWSESFEEYRYTNSGLTGDSWFDPKEIERERHKNNTQLMDQEKFGQSEAFKLAYAEILYRWQLFESRAEVLKFVCTPPEPHRGIEFVNMCQTCHREVRGSKCMQCRTLVFQCCVCHVSVRGASSFCIICGHGGHARHMRDWFCLRDWCPTGCGCHCTTYNQESEASEDKSKSSTPTLMKAQTLPIIPTITRPCKVYMRLNSTIKPSESNISLSS